MSCLEFIDNYAEESVEHQRDTILDDTLDCLKDQEDRRKQQLQDFIEDFVKSQEYAHYIEQKRTIIKRSAATQCDFNEIIVECKENELLVKYPLTEERKKMYAFKKHFESYAENLRKKASLKKQKYGIQIIKMKIHEAKRIFECTREFKEKEKKRTDQFLIQKYSAQFGIDMRTLSTEAQIKILERFKKCHHKISLKNAQRQNNLIKIVEKLCQEEKLKRTKQKEFKINRREKIISDMEIVGTHIEMIDRNETKMVQVEPVKQSKEIQTEAEASKKVKVKKETNKKKDKKEKSKKDKSNKESKKIYKNPKTKKPKVKTAAKFVLPSISIINPRRKILPENIDDLIKIVEEFRDLDNALENGGLNQNHLNYPLDLGLQFKPHEITFENFETDKSYSKKIIITNVTAQIRKVRFLCYEFADQYDQIAFKVEPFGIQKLFTGCKFQFNLTFQPWDSNKLWIGKAIFLSYDTRSCQYYQSELALRCLPKYSNLIIRPDSVSFGEIPIWRIGSEHFKTIKNTGAKPCTISIRKIWDPLQIESILDDDEENKENVPPKSSSSNMVEDILDECLKNVDNNFEFTDGYFTLAEFDSKLVKVVLKNTSYVGDYLEKFRVEVLEKDQNGILQSNGCQIITLKAETTGHFLSTQPEVIDFGICLIHTCYQTSFDICNNSQNTQAVSIKVPASISEMVQMDVSMVYIGPKSRRTVFIKLIPSSSSNWLAYNDSPYFDKNNLILHFPVRLYGTTKFNQDYPPIKMPVYAIIGNFEDLTISCNSTRNLSNFLNTILIDVGDCSIYETIWTEIFVTNNTAVTQICGFVNLPKCIMLVPNFGFCKLHPGHRKKFKIYISPDIKDFPSYSIGSLRNSNCFFQIKVDTIIGLGKLDLEDTVRETKNSSMDFAKKLTITDTEAFNSMTGLVSDIKQQSQFETTQSMINKEGNIMSRGNSILRSDFFPVADSRRQSSISQITNKREDSGDMDTLLNYHNFLIVETESRRDVWCKVNIRRPWLEFSHQFVHFPDTPPGSYSTMEIILQALEREIENPRYRKKSRLNYKARFQIAGGGQEILVEPSCGVLSSGDFIKITLLVKPKIPNEIIEQVAKSQKYAEVYSRKLEQYQAALSKKPGKKGKTPKKSKNLEKPNKKQSNKQQADSKKDEQPNITVDDSELVIESSDLFPAEMEYWRSLEPYYIKNNFTCIVDYETPKGHRKKDRLYLEAICKVIRPDFIINLNQQRIDFGNCLVGMKVVKTVKLQNITYKPIKPRVSLLNPLGPFSVPHFADTLTVAPEEFFEIPIIFKPTNTVEVTEYIEIQSDASIICLILCGNGNSPNLNLSPEFGVYRLETKRSKLAELQFKVENPSEAPATVHFDKLFEIEGLLSELNPQKEQSTDPQSSEKKKVKTEKSKKGKEKPVKTPKSSDDLTEEEVETIGRAFKLSEGGSHIDIHVTQTRIELPSNARSSVTIVCGNPELIKKKQTQGPKEKKKKDKQESVGKSEVSTKPNSTEEVIKVNDKQYIAQFNIKVGNEFIKSIVIICTIKG